VARDPEPEASLSEIRVDVDTLAEELLRAAPAETPDEDTHLDEDLDATRIATAAEPPDDAPDPTAGDELQPEGDEPTELFAEGGPTVHTAVASVPAVPGGLTVTSPSAMMTPSPYPAAAGPAPVAHVTPTGSGVVLTPKRNGPMRWVAVAAIALGLGTLTAALLSGDSAPDAPTPTGPATTPTPANAPAPPTEPPAPPLASPQDDEVVVIEPPPDAPATAPPATAPAEPPPEPAPAVEPTTSSKPARRPGRRRGGRRKKRNKKRPLDGMYPSG
jgi:hypothetical protein